MKGSVLLLFLLFYSGIANAQQFMTADYVILGRSLSLPGYQICHDGQDLYYKDVKYCDPFRDEDGCANLKIAPIFQSEVISIDKDKEIYRFYAVPLKYKVYRFDIVNGGTQNIRYEDRDIAFCEGKRLKLGDITKTYRSVHSEEEKVFLSVLYNQGVNIINTGFGPIENIRNVNIEFHQPGVLKTEAYRNIRTPWCGNDYYHEFLRKAGGEYSGNGVTSEENPKDVFLEFQESSGSIDAKTIKGSYPEDVKDYRIYCNSTVTV